MLRIYPTLNQATAIQFLDYVIQRLPFQVEVIIIDNAAVFNDTLREWEDCYNYHRPHGGLGGQTPYERLKQKTTTQA